MGFGAASKHRFPGVVEVSTPTDNWLATMPALPRLAGPEATAEKLLLLLHYGVDWDNSWVSRRRETYWTHHLPSHVRVATYLGGADLDNWWSVVADALESEPRNIDERLELAILLRNQPEPVLTVLRDRTTALVLRTRIVAESVQAQRAQRRSRR